MFDQWRARTRIESQMRTHRSFCIDQNQAFIVVIGDHIWEKIQLI